MNSVPRGSSPAAAWWASALALLIALAGAAGAQADRAGSTLRVFAAASLADAFGEILSDFVSDWPAADFAAGDRRLQLSQGFDARR